MICSIGLQLSVAEGLFALHPSRAAWHGLIGWERLAGLAGQPSHINTVHMNQPAVLLSHINEPTTIRTCQLSFCICCTCAVVLYVRFWLYVVYIEKKCCIFFFCVLKPDWCAFLIKWGLGFVWSLFLKVYNKPTMQVMGHRLLNEFELFRSCN